MTVTLQNIAEYADAYLRITEISDYPPALNGVQMDHRGPVRKIGAAVDFSLRTLEAAVAADVNLMLVHHGMFWSGPQRLRGRFYERVRTLVEHDIAVYSAHLPLDAHEVHGNSRLLARELALAPSDGFAAHAGTWCGVRGDAEVTTASLHARVDAFARAHGGRAVASEYAEERMTRRWAICSGSGATVDTLREAASLGIDTLIVGEGPHWSGVDAPENDLVILYGGHYATETLGVQSLAAHLEKRFGVPWIFLPAPTGL